MRPKFRFRPKPHGQPKINFVEVREGEMFFIKRVGGRFGVFAYHPGNKAWTEKVLEIGNGDKFLKALASCASFIAAEQTPNGPLIAIGHVSKPAKLPHEKERIIRETETRTIEDLKRIAAETARRTGAKLVDYDYEHLLHMAKETVRNPIIFADDAANIIRSHFNNPQIVIAGGTQHYPQVPASLERELRAKMINNILKHQLATHEGTNYLSITPLKGGQIDLNIAGLHFFMKQEDYFKILAQERHAMKRELLTDKY